MPRVSAPGLPTIMLTAGREAVKGEAVGPLQGSGGGMHGLPEVLTGEGKARAGSQASLEGFGCEGWMVRSLAGSLSMTGVGERPPEADEPQHDRWGGAPARGG